MLWKRIIKLMLLIWIRIGAFIFFSIKDCFSFSKKKLKTGQNLDFTKVIDAKLDDLLEPGYVELYDFSEPSVNGYSLIHLLCMKGNGQHVTRLVRKLGRTVVRKELMSKPIEALNVMPVQAAILFNNFEVFHALKNEVKAPTKLSDVNHKYPGCVNSMIYGATINDRSNRFMFSSLETILQVNHSPLTTISSTSVQSFLYGTPVNEQNSEGKTALHYAVRSNNLKAVALLLHLDADPSIVDNWGVNPIQVAIDNRNAQSYDMLRLAIPKSNYSALTWMERTQWSIRFMFMFQTHFIQVCLKLIGIFISLFIFCCKFSHFILIVRLHS